MSGSAPGLLQETRQQWKAVVASSVGGMLEWYDFAIYGYLSPIISARFFPSDNSFLSLLATFGVFAVGFLFRPFGGLLLGHIGDRYGRKPVLWLSVTLMGGSTLGMGLLPDYIQWGEAAPVLLVLLRILQGISVGGEFIGSTVYMAELGSTRNRAYMASWPEFGCFCGYITGSVIGTLLTVGLGEEVMHAWGWRVPFWIGGVIAVFGVLIRQHLPETQTFLKADKSQDLPIFQALKDNWKTMLHMIFLVVGCNICMILVLTYFISTYAQQTSLIRSFWVSNIGLAVSLLVTPLGCALSDRVGRKPVLYISALGILFLSWPLWWMMHQEVLWLTVAAVVVFTILSGVGLAVSAVSVIELMPTQVRCSGVSVGYNLCLAVFGGSTPLLSVYLVHTTGSLYAPVYYLMLMSLVSLVATTRIPELAGRPL